MTRDDVLKMARTSGMTEAGIKQLLMIYEIGFRDGLNALAESGWRQCAIGQKTTQYCGMAEQARLEEREACAKVCEKIAEEFPFEPHEPDPVLPAYCAEAIRARSEK